MKNSISTRLLKVLIGSAFMLSSTAFMFSNPTCPRNYTGAPSASSGQIRFCTSCHGDFAINIAGSSVVATGLPSGSYAPGQAYSFSIKITHPTAINTIWGFAIKAVNTTNNQVAGTFTTTNANASVKGSAGNQDLELSHSTAATSAAASTYTYQNLTWTAPATPTGNESNIRFYITGLAGDGDDSEAGDYVYTSTVDAALSALPLRLTSFQVSQADSKAVLIKWQTAQEENTSGFEIQSSTNSTDWKVVSTLPAKGNASITQNYTYTDGSSLMNANSNVLYFRLRIVDKDGSFQYSNVKSLQLKLSPFVVQSLSPSPAQSNTGLQFRIQCGSSQSIMTTVTDVNGKMLYSNKKDVSMGTSVISLPSQIMGATKGMVFIKFSNGQGTETTFKQIIE